MTRSPASRLPQPPVRPLVGNVPDIDREATVQSMMRLAREYGPIYRLAFPRHSIAVISSRELVSDACDETRFEKHIHGPLKEIRALAGDGLFTAENDEANWGKAHRILMPAFGPHAMRHYFEDMRDVAEQMFTRWERFGPETVIDVADNMTRLTLDTIALSAFHERFNSFYRDEMHPFVEAMVRSLQEAGDRAKRVPLQTQLMLLTRRQYEADIALMHATADALVAKRRTLPPSEAPRDLLGLMLGARDPLTGEGLSDENIRHQLVTFLIAGHETTSGLLSFAVHLLLAHPEALQRARAEVDAVFADETPRYEHLAELKYVDQVLRETLRLWPTAPAFGVHAKEDTVLAGQYPVKKGEVLLALLPTLHRDPAVWKDPERFDPDRFAPGARETIPEHAWMPFGNGQRSCIGRAFALQEATLVLAMMLQRFDFRTPSPYRLQVKETLTLKPDGLEIVARRRQAPARVSPARGAAAVTPSSANPTAAHGTRLLVLYGSNSGSSEAFARQIAGSGAGRGFAATVAPLDEFAGRLPKDGAVVIVSASYNGQPPDNARRFVASLDEAAPGSLAGVRYAVFGCGNRDWAATYQAVPTRIDEKLSAAGAEPLVPRGEADARGDFFGDFEQWHAPLWDALATKLGIEAKAEAGPLYAVEVVSPGGTELVQQNRLAAATVVSNRELVDLTAKFARSKRHLEISLPEGMTYEAGDYLAVLPENHPELVERAARRFGLRPGAAVVLRSNRGAMAASLPTERPVSLHDLLATHVELSSPATRRDLERLAAHNRCPPHRDHLLALAKDPARYKAEILDLRVSVLDLLERWASIELGLGEFLELLPAMRVRQYSISSSPKVDPSHCTLTVAVVDAPALSGNGRFRGVASSHLAGLKAGDTVHVAVRRPNVPFRPPASNETPMILVGAGTGLAPFRGFIQERAARREGGESAGKTLLFFGCDHPDVDFLYRNELAMWEQEGIVEVLPAFFRAPDGDVSFVQHRVWKERAQVAALLEAGASVFVCGDGQRMAPAVKETFARLHAERLGVSMEEGERYVKQLEEQGRYVADVFA